MFRTESFCHRPNPSCPYDGLIQSAACSHVKNITFILPRICLYLLLRQINSSFPMCVYIYIYIYLFMYIHTHIHIYTHTHTHKHTLRSCHVRYSIIFQYNCEAQTFSSHEAVRLTFSVYNLFASCVLHILPV